MPKPTMTREQAFARHAELLRDAGWAKRYIGGDAAARREAAELHRIMAGEVARTPTPREQAETRKAELMADPAWQALYLGGDVTARAEMIALNQAIASEGAPAGDHIEALRPASPTPEK